MGRTRLTPFEPSSTEIGAASSRVRACGLRRDETATGSRAGSERFERRARGGRPLRLKLFGLFREWSRGVARTVLAVVVLDEAEETRGTLVTFLSSTSPWQYARHHVRPGAQ